jgi:hypothetical protein
MRQIVSTAGSFLFKIMTALLFSFFSIPLLKEEQLLNFNLFLVASLT